MTAIKPFDARYLQLAEDRLSGFAMQDLSMKYSMSIPEILEALEIPEIERFIQSTISNLGYNNRSRRAALIERIIDKKIEEAEENDMWSRKDLAELLKLAQDEDKLISPSGPTISITKNEQNNNYMSLMKDLLEVQPS